MSHSQAYLGIAAVHIGGMTIHSFAGVGKGEDGVEHYKKRLSKRAKKHWKDCQTLVIDEVSMVSCFYQIT
jgi:ATP-dependent DNA helicase PIF1